MHSTGTALNLAFERNEQTCHKWRCSVRNRDGVRTEKLADPVRFYLVCTVPANRGRSVLGANSIFSVDIGSSQYKGRGRASTAIASSKRVEKDVSSPGVGMILVTVSACIERRDSP